VYISTVATNGDYKEEEEKSEKIVLNINFIK